MDPIKRSPPLPLIPLADFYGAPVQPGLALPGGSPAPRSGQAPAAEPAPPAPKRQRKPKEDSDDDMILERLFDRLGISTDDDVWLVCGRRLPTGEFETLPEIQITDDMLEDGARIEQIIGSTFQVPGIYRYKLRKKNGTYLKSGGKIIISKEFAGTAPLFEAEPPPSRPADPATIAGEVARQLAPYLDKLAAPKQPDNQAEKFLMMILTETKENNRAQMEIMLKRLESAEKMTANLLEKVITRVTAPAPVSPPAETAAPFAAFADQLEDFSRAATAMDKIRGRAGDEDEEDFDDGLGPQELPVQPFPAAPAAPQSLSDRLASKGLDILDSVGGRLGGVIEEKLVEMVQPAASAPRKLSVVTNPEPAAAPQSTQWDQLVAIMEGWAKSKLPVAQVQAEINSTGVAEQFNTLTPDTFADFLQSINRPDLAGRILAAPVKTYLESVQAQMRRAG